MTAVAIIGMGAVFPGSDGLDGFWEDLLQGRDAARPVDPRRWRLPPAELDAGGAVLPDRVRQTRVCHVPTPAGLPTESRLSPECLVGLDPLNRVLLHAGHRAWADAGRPRGERVGIVIGNIVLPTEHSAAAAEQLLLPGLLAAAGLPPGEPPAATSPDDHWYPGRAASLLADSLGCRGPVWTLDAACASSLYALHYACRLVQEERCEVVIAGGLSRPDSLYTQMGFSALTALSASGRCAPFSAAADGLLVGEGCGLVVVKSLQRARRDGDRIDAIVAGSGLSNDRAGSLVQPAAEGQLRALEEAYRRAGWEPGQVQAIECHGTGTPTGDRVEVSGLQELWRAAGASGRCAIASAKANVGHLLTAAGSVGLIKMLLAMRHGVLPPQANFQRPHPDIPFEDGPLYVPRQPETWDAAERRCAVSAFGFGGINAHILLQQPGEPSSRTSFNAAVPPPRRQAIAVVGYACRVGPWTDAGAVLRRLAGWDHSQPDADGCFAIEDLHFPFGRHRIPPTQLTRLVPQQALALAVAHDALEHAGLTAAEQERTGVAVGIGADPQASNFHLRWLFDHAAGGQDPDWRRTARDQVHHALDAEGVLGHLGGIVASRIARDIGAGGASHTVGGDELAGLAALQLGCEQLHSGQVDRMLVGAVDLTSDPRARAALRAGGINGGINGPLSDAGVVLVLERAEEAAAAGRPIYATIDEVQLRHAPDGDDAGSPDPEEDDGLLAGRWRARPRQRLGFAGSAQALVDGLAGVLACVHRLIYADDGPGGSRRSMPWLQDEDAGPRRVTVGCSAAGGGRGLLRLQAGTVFDARNGAPWPGLPYLVQAADRAELQRATAALLDEADAAGEALAQAQAARALTRSGPYRAAVVAENAHELRQRLQELQAAIAAGDELQRPGRHWRSAPLAGELAFVFPGSGNHRPGMGLPWALRCGQVLAAEAVGQRRYASQFGQARFWSDGAGDWCGADGDHNLLIMAQVWLGVFCGDIGRELGLEPRHVIGYSLGETKSLFFTRAWTDRDGMLERIEASDLFTAELAGERRAARRHWRLPADQAVDWSAGVIDCDRARLEAVLAGRERVYLLIENTPATCLIGGRRPAVDALVAELGCSFHPIAGVTTVHCPVVESVAEAYRELHLFPTAADPAITYYSGIRGGAYPVDRDSAADSILGQALAPCSFPTVIEDAYRRGARVFVETGPGASCSSFIDRTLGDRPHLACSLGHLGEDAPARIGDSLARLWVAGVDYDPCRFFANLAARPAPPPARSIDVALRQRIGHPPPAPKAPTAPPPPPSPATQPTLGPPSPSSASRPEGPASTDHAPPAPRPSAASRPTALASVVAERLAAVTRLAAAQSATARGHQAFLQATAAMQTDLDRLFGLAGDSRRAGPAAERTHPAVAAAPQAPDAARPADAASGTACHPRPVRPVPVHSGDRWPSDPTGTLHGYDACMELAVGSVAAVYGPDWAYADRQAQRVRLPDEPLMLCHRIMAIEGEPHSLGPGRMITEHDILDGVWYLDGGVMPTALAIESGQADLVLSGWLGIDAEHSGDRTYRLLDAQVIFHRGLPPPGSTLRYDIRIEEFFQQDGIWLFRFQFDGTVDGEPLLTMRNGCAGFFTQADLDAGQGIVHSRLEVAPQPGRVPHDWRPPVPLSSAESYDAGRLDALRAGDLAACFGPDFSGLDLRTALTLPSDRLRLVHRIASLDPQGGRCGIGRIVGEADIQPDDWFLTCHFAGDEVMPGTLMYECCLHTLRVYMLRLGWLAEEGQAVVEPIPGQASSLRCRGQVLASTRLVTYRVDVVAYGFAEDGTPEILAEALMSADGKPIVWMTGLCARLQGQTRAGLDRLWHQRRDDQPAPPPAWLPLPALRCPGTGRPLDAEHIATFADGDPSAAFGAAYRPFDHDRVIARLPREPYTCISRIVGLSGAEQWRLQEAAEVVADYDVPPTAWYFDDEGGDRMPYAFLLEVALQPCGWLAAYSGAALTSAEDLRFRNLGGRATQHGPVTRAAGLLRTRATMTGCSQSGGMIILHYRFTVEDAGGPVLDGTTYFGFFTQAALDAQAGIREATPPPRSGPAQRPQPFPTAAPMPGGRLRLLDRLVHADPAGGPAGCGHYIAELDVDPAAWFFQAHFKQDPVCPGSLGLESFLQILKLVAQRRWADDGRPVAFDSQPAGQAHEWIYRGQIRQHNRLVEVHCLITGIDEAQRRLVADGFLVIDGLVIYQLQSFAVALR